MGPFGSDLELAELLMRTLTDTEPPQPADLAYLFGQTPDNEDSVLQRGAVLLQQGMARRLGVTLHPASDLAYAGGEAWMAKLERLAIQRANIVGLDYARPLAHTHTEAEHLVWRARDEGWHALLIVAVPVHQLRAFMDTVGVLIREKLDRTIRVWNAAGTPHSWVKEVVHSQGILRARRFELVRPELERIVRYWGKGDMPIARQVLDYLNWRDGA